MQATITLGPFMRLYLLLIAAKERNYGASTSFIPKGRCYASFLLSQKESRRQQPRSSGEKPLLQVQQ